VRRGGYTFKYDLSVAQREMYPLVQAVRDRLRGTGALVAGYGHVGDGNVHINVGCPPRATPQQIAAAAALLEPFVFERVGELRGSISAEHGIGQMKVAALGWQLSDVAVGHMRALKAHFDPSGILNPYKVLPPLSPPPQTPRIHTYTR
jgi:D-2-hydroxyglutarate dehydrogenase